MYGKDDNADIGNFYQRTCLIFKLIDYMCKGMEDLINEGRQEGSEERGILNAKSMLEDGMSIDLVSKYSHLSADKVKKLKSEMEHQV